MKTANMLIYYGWLNSFNSAVNQWNNEKVAQDIAKYDVCVFGNGLADPTHGDFANTQIIISRLMVLKPSIQIFGYATACQFMDVFQTMVNQWEALGIQGIFLDEAGYDYGVTREQFNAKVDFVHSKESANICFANSWNMDHVIGRADDPNFPNSNFNPGLVDSNLYEDDWYLLESFTVNTVAYVSNGGFAHQSDVIARAEKAIKLSKNYRIKVGASGVIDNSSIAGKVLSDFNYHTALACDFDAQGTSDTYYGASTAAVTFWSRPKPRAIEKTEAIVLTPDANDPQIILRYGQFSRVLLNFTPESQSSSIETW